MCNYIDYTEKDFDMSSSANLYHEDETDVAIMLSDAVTGGLTLSKICRLKTDVGEAGLDTFSTKNYYRRNIRTVHNRKLREGEQHPRKSILFAPYRHPKNPITNRDYFYILFHPRKPILLRIRKDGNLCLT